MIDELTFKQIDSLSVEEVKGLLNQEYEEYEKNSEIEFEMNSIDSVKMINLLESILNAESNMKITDYGKFPTKLAGDVLKFSKLEEEEFYRYLRILYMNDYIDFLKIGNFNINEESELINGEGISKIDRSYITRYNLHRIYRSHSNLFNEENFRGFENIGSEEMMYNKLLNYGTIVNCINSPLTSIGLSDKGLHFLHLETSKRSVILVNKQKESLVAINEAKKDQMKLLSDFENHKQTQQNNIDSINDLITDLNSKIKNFYKDITTILSIMVASFALIGVNISAIPKIESNFTANLLAMNLSLILVMLVLFYILKVIVYDSKINSRHFYSILIVTVVGIVGVFIFLGFNHESKVEVIEKKYQEMLQEHTTDNQNKLLEMQNQMEQLEREINVP